MNVPIKKLVSRHDDQGVATLTLERGDAYNALSDELLAAYADAVKNAAEIQNRFKASLEQSLGK